MVTKIKQCALEIAKETRKVLYLGIMAFYIGLTFTAGAFAASKLSGVIVAIAVTADDTQVVEP